MLLKTLVMLSALFLTTACSWCEIEVEKIKTVEIKVPQKCIVPKPQGCKWDNIPAHEVPVKLLECIIELKKNTEVCQ